MTTTPTAAPADHATDPTYLALLAGVCAEPAEDTPRLVLADWLEEHGQGERGHLVRWMVRRPSWFADATCLEDGDYSPEYLRALDWLKGGSADAELGRIIGGAWATVEGMWVWHKGQLVAQDFRATYSRGFVSEITLSPGDWFANHAALYWHPEQTVECGNCDGGQSDYRLTGGVSFIDGARSCPVCSGTWRVARPCPSTAQPLEVVRLTETPAVDWRGPVARSWVAARLAALGGRYYTPPELGIESIADPRAALLAREWPRITFRLPGDEE